ncbi:hypothetical protein QBC34DRAFT_424809 [Podospora aff. communis PSN243]|uniref:Uncharacterized protein n=1 Tax=Podospora aff. communis PSN243 TaxID=3040156 RepID=A0AAV9GUD5_9PEZI|nr:hypothetical protein QBC34DRAFT_424809 [Podospora aff. communis PSN243]
MACEEGSDESVLPMSLIPANLNIALIAGQNTSVPWMSKCCAPNHVKMVHGCWLWCEIPSDRIEVTEDKSLLSDFNGCVMNESLHASNQTLVAALRLLNASGQMKPTTAAVCIWAMIVAGFLGSVV